MPYPQTNAWLTPDTPTDAARKACWGFRFPQGSPSVMAAFQGAIAELAKPENWQEFGTMTPAEAALLFSEIIEDRIMTGCPIGMLAQFLTTAVNVPAGWLACDGTVYTKATYPDLWAMLAHNPPVVTLTVSDFAIDMRDLFLVSSTSAAIGSAGGAASVTLTTNQMPNHRHRYNEPVLGTIIEGLELPAAAVTGITTLRDTTLVTGHSEVGGAALPHENRPPYAVVGYYIWSGVG